MGFLMDIVDLRAKYLWPGGKEITGVIHVGARMGEEAVEYAANGIANVWWIEANPAVIGRLQANVAPLGHHVIPALVTDRDGVPTPFHVTNYDGMSSSVLPFGSHPEFSPDTVFVDHLVLVSRTLDSLVAEHRITGCNMLVMDLQGAEALALTGAPLLLAGIDLVQSEINDRDVYEGCAKVWELDSILSDFTRVETHWVRDQGWGDGAWVRTSLNERTGQ